MDKIYNFKKQERIWRSFWRKEKIYKFQENSKKSIFSVDTPPPYVSAEHLHTGHIMSYAQAEFIIRFKRMQGYNVFYPMGFDDNGLPTERFVEKKYNLDKSKISRKDFIKKCLKETKVGAKNYKRLWNLLGISADWSKTYSTINPHCRKIAQWSFIDLYKKGKLKRHEEPIHWCPSCQTALAQADLEDKEEKTWLNYIEFKTENNKPLLLATTRPELLPACVALFYHPQDKRYQGLKNKKSTVPLFNYQVPILEDESVDKNFGTGLMMVCTWGDMDDIKKWKKYNLETRAIFTEKDKPENIFRKRKNILKHLKEIKLLKKQEEITHILNVHDRCNTSVEFILTKQWFISLLDNKKNLIRRGNQLRWFPEFMKTRYMDWVNGLTWNWCISRQRYYGVPFPVWYCKNCQEIILPSEKDLPVDPSEEKAKIKRCPKCGNGDFVGEKDVMDTWMTSSLTPIIGARLVKNKKNQKKLYPTTLRPQAFEIIRTWLFYTIVKSHYHHNILPFRDVMISGHGLDEKGRKISKKLGNYINPQEIIKEYGADALRYWTTGAKLGTNTRYSKKEVEKGKKTVIKIWNASKFTISHLRDFAPQKNFKPKELTDIWLLHELQKTIQKTNSAFETYEYSEARNIIDRFFWDAFCDNYLEFVKHRLYEQNDNQAKNTLYIALLSILKIYAPILPFITEEIYQLFFRKIEKNKSIHISSWPKINKLFIANLSQIKEFKKILKIIEEVRKYKSAHNMSMGQEIEAYQISDKVLIKKHGEMIKKIMRIKQIKYQK